MNVSRGITIAHHAIWYRNSSKKLNAVWQPLSFHSERCNTITTKIRTYSLQQQLHHNNGTGRRRSSIACPKMKINRIFSSNAYLLSNPPQSSLLCTDDMKLPLHQRIRSFHTTPWYQSADASVATLPADGATPLDANEISPPILWTTHRLKSEQIQKIDSIFHKILWLDLFESSMLNDIVNEKMGVTLNNKQKRQLTQLMEQRAQEALGNMSSNMNDSAATEEVEAGPVLVDMKLASYDATSKIKVIKEVRSILNLGLKEAKEMVESAPVTLQKGMKQELAEELKIKLEAVGAKIEIS